VLNLIKIIGLSAYCLILSVRTFSAKDVANKIGRMIYQVIFLEIFDPGMC
jgi:hypothetical protein